MATKSKTEEKSQELQPSGQEQTMPRRYRGRGLSLFDDMDRFMNDMFRRGWMRPSLWDWPELAPMGEAFEGRWPRVDVIDRDEEILVNVEVPGVNKEDLDVSLGDDNVTIRATSKRESKEEKGHYFRCEIARGEFSRTIPLPAPVDGAKAKASFKDGVLRLTLPKAQGAARRSIKIETD